MNGKKIKKKGFTLVELVIVILIISILAVTLVPQFSNVINKAKSVGVTQDFREYQTAAMDVLYTYNGKPDGNAADFIDALNKRLDNECQFTYKTIPDEHEEGAVNIVARRSKRRDPWNTKYALHPTLKGGSGIIDAIDGIAFLSAGPNKKIDTDYIMIREDSSGKIIAQCYDKDGQAHEGATPDAIDQALGDDIITYIAYTREGSIVTGNLESQM